MPIPNADRAIIAPEKLRDYLLAAEGRGRGKAAFFGTLGYRRPEWQRLEADRRSQHLTLDAHVTVESEYGRKYVIRGALEGPTGVRMLVVSIWIVDAGSDTPRFVTAYPGRSS